MFKFKEEHGFTLIELMVVILIIAILMAVGIPAFLGARSRGQDNVAKQAITNSAKAAASYFASNQALPANALAMGNEESAYTYSDALVAPAAATPPAIAYQAATGTFRITSASNTVWKITVDPTNGTVGSITPGN